MHRQLNFKLVGTIVGVVCVLVVGAHLVHGLQVGRNTDLLLTQAERAAKQGKRTEAIGRYMQYLGQRDNAAAYEQLAELLATETAAPDAARRDIKLAYDIYERALRLHPELDSVRRRLAELTLTKFGRVGDAMKQYEELRKIHPGDVELELRLAQCQAALGQVDGALLLFYEILGFNPATRQFDVEKPRGAGELDAYVLLADLLRRKFEDAEQADLVMRQMIAANPTVPRAFLLAARYEERSRRRAQAVKYLAQALALAPEDGDVILAASELAIADRKFDQARELLERGIKKYPTSESMIRAQANLAQAEDKPEEAIKIVETALKMLPQSPALWLYLADMQLQRRDLDGAVRSLKSLEKLNVRPELIDFMQCRLLTCQEKWLTAAQRLARIRPLLSDLPEIAKQIDMLLGEAYERLGQPDRELDIYHKALMRDPTLLTAKLGEARALAALGNSEMAIDSLTELAGSLARNNVPMPSIVRNQLLQLRIAQQLRLPKDRRDWRDAEVLAQGFLDDPGQSSTQKAIIRGELKFMQDHVEEATSILLAALRQSPKELAIWLSLLNMMQRDYDVEKTQKFIDRARQELGDIVPFRVAQANLWVRIAGPELRPRLLSLEKGLEKFPLDQQTAFWSDMGNLYYRLRDYDNTRRCWTRVAEARSEDPRLRQTLFELAVEFSKPDDMRASAEILRDLTGPTSSVYKYACACEIVWQVRSKKQDRSSLLRARDLVAEARSGRADWYEVARLNAEIDELDGKIDDAIAGYRRALELSPGHGATARRLVELLYSRGRLGEAREAIELVGATSPSDTIRKIDSDIHRQMGRREESLKMAEAAVEDAPQDAGNRVWLGQLLDASGRTADAEREFRRAVELQPSSGMYWLLLAHHLMSTKKPNAAADLLSSIQRSVAPDEAPQVLAQYYEVVGELKQAEKIYLDRAQEHPDDTAEMQSRANFYLRTKQFPQLDKTLDKLIALCTAGSSDDLRERLHWARRTKAQVLRNKGDFESLLRAVKLIEANSQNGHYSTEDATLLASMLSERPEAESRQKAVKLLEQLQAKRPLPDELHAQLAQLYERSGRWDKAREQLLNLLGRLGNHPGYMTMLALLQLKHDEVDDAARWIHKVVVAQPGTAQSLELQARLLAKQGKPEAAVELVKAFAPDSLPDDQVGRLAAAAAILEGIGELQPAEIMYRRLLSRQPRAELAVANFLGRHFDLDEAFRLLEKSRRSQPLSTVIATSLNCMRVRRADFAQRHIDQIKAWIDLGVKEEPQNTAFRMCEADLYDQLHQLDKVVNAYTAILKIPTVKGAQQAVAKNNLAFVLTLRNGPGDLDSAKGLIDEAIQVLGPSPDLQDTRGMVWLTEGKTADAVRELTKSVDEGGSPPRYVHLAFALDKAGDHGGAARSITRAREMGLDPDSLSGFEQDRYNALVKQLGL